MGSGSFCKKTHTSSTAPTTNPSLRYPTQGCFSNNHTVFLLYYCRAACYFIDEDLWATSDSLTLQGHSAGLFQQWSYKALKTRTGQALCGGANHTLAPVFCCHPGTVLVYWNQCSPVHNSDITQLAYPCQDPFPVSSVDRLHCPPSKAISDGFAPHAKSQVFVLQRGATSALLPWITF